MMTKNTKTGRWPVPRRARVRVRLGRYLVVGRFVRVRTRALSPPPTWGLFVVHGRVGYGRRDENGRIEFWRPLTV